MNKQPELEPQRRARKWAPLRRTFAVGVAASAIALASAGCGRDDATAGAEPCALDPNPWACELQRMYYEAESEFVRDVLRDWRITTVEKQEAAARVEACFAAAGYPATHDGEGGFVAQDDFRAEDGSIDFVALERRDEATSHCLGEGAALVSAYLMIRDNPDAIRWESLVVDCLHRHELVPADFSVEDYIEATADPCPLPETMAEAEESNCWLSVSPADGRPDLADLPPGATMACNANLCAIENPDYLPNLDRYLIPGLRLDWHADLTPEEQAVHACVGDPAW